MKLFLVWYYNIQPNPQDVTIEVLDKKMKINPEIVLGERRRPLYDRIVSIAPNYGAYEKGSMREILLVLFKHIIK